MFTTTALAGDGGIGKSLLAMQLMTCCGAGKRFLNKDTLPCVSLGLFCEDYENQLHERQNNIIAHYGVGYPEIADVHYMPRVGEDNAIVEIKYDKPVATEFFKQFRQVALDIGAKLVVIDTAADTFAGNENIRAQVRAYVQLLNGLANELQGAVVLLMHPSLSGLGSGSGTSGSTAWNNSVRSRWYLEKDHSEEADDNVRILSHKKSNYSAAESGGIELLWKEGAFELKLDENSFMKKLEMTRIKKECLDLIEHLYSQNIPLSIYEQARNYAPRKLREKFRVKPSLQDIKTCIEQMLDEKTLVNVHHGAPSRMQFCLRDATAYDVPTMSPTSD